MSLAVSQCGSRSIRLSRYPAPRISRSHILVMLPGFLPKAAIFWRTGPSGRQCYSGPRALLSALLPKRAKRPVSMLFVNVQLRPAHARGRAS